MRSGLYARLFLILSLTLVLAQLCLPAEGFVLSELPADEYSPLRQKLEDAGCVVLDISGVWNYKTGNSEQQHGWIPSAFSGAELSVDFTKRVSLPDSLQDYDWELLIPAYRHRVDVFVNGNLLLAGRGDYASLRVPIRQEQLVFGNENEFLLQVQNDLNRTTSVPLKPSLFQPADYAGIFSEVFLVGRQDWSLTGFAHKYEWTQDSGSVSSRVELRVNPQLTKSRPSQQDSLIADADIADIKLSAVLRDSSNTAVVSTASIVLSEYYTSSHSHPLRFETFTPIIWCPKRPYQYRLELFLVHQRDTLCTWSDNVSFTSVRLDGAEFICGDNVFKLRAIDYILQDPAGIPVPNSILYSDLNQIKSLGFNAVRISGSAPSENLLDAADSIGIWILTDIGFHDIPAELITAEMINSIRSGPMMQAVRSARAHPCVLSICTGSMLDFSCATVDSVASVLTTETRDLTNLPCYIETTGAVPDIPNVAYLMVKREPYAFTLPKAIPTANLPVVYSNLGWLSKNSIQSDSSTSYAQKNVLKYQVSSAYSKGNTLGVALHCFADYNGAEPLIVQSNHDHSTRYSFGLFTSNRRSKISEAEISLILNDQDSQGIIGKPQRETKNPIVFPATALAAMLILSLSMRGNNVFRQNLRRVFRHSHGFFSDIRYRRYLPTSHTVLLWFLNSATIAGVIVSIAFWMRESIHLDYFLTFIGLSADTKSYIASLLWSPGQALVIVYLFVSVCKLLHIVYLKLLSNLFRPRVSLWQIWNYTNWAFAPLLFLLPLCAILYRLLDFDALVVPAFVACGIVFLWCLVRLISALQNGFQTSPFRVSLLFVTLTGVIAAGLYFSIDHWLHFSLYWHWILQLYPIS